MPQENKKTLALRFEQMARKAFVNKAKDIRNAQMKDALVTEIDPQLARKTLKILLTTNQQNWNPSFYLHKNLRKSIKKTKLEHI